MAYENITVHKAHVHNLKGITVSIPKNTLTVVTGPSGSGKSSLAFDTIYVEGQRRYIESLSSYARQFLGVYNPPDVESIEGLSPSIAIDQKTTSKNPRSTVGTITEIYDYMRILYARAGTLYCPESGVEIRSYTPAQVARELSQYKERTKIQLLAPIAHDPKTDMMEVAQQFAGMGFNRLRLNGELTSLEENPKLKIPKNPKLEVIVDRLLVKEGIEARLVDSIELAYKYGGGGVIALIEKEGEKAEERFFSELNISSVTKVTYPPLEPRLFSFNSPIGACPACNGLGEKQSFNRKLMIQDPDLSIDDGAILPIAKKNSFLYHMAKTVCEDEGIDMNVPLKKLPKKQVEMLFEGNGEKVYEYRFSTQGSSFRFSKEFPGINNWLNKKFLESESERLRLELEQYMNIQPCDECHGMRLNGVALSTKIHGKSIMELGHLSIGELYDFFAKNKFTGDKAKIAEKLLKEITSRLKFLLDVGLDYLTLNRAAGSLSGGESQRIRLATQIGSALSGVLYVLDEPSIGLHQKDNQSLIETLKNLRDLGNTILVVEHDEDAIQSADYIVDMGPGAGTHGGEVVAAGTLDEIMKNKKSLTAKYLLGEMKIDVPNKRRELTEKISLKGAKENNLKNLSVDIPLKGLVCITGVSGSGKSTLVHEVLVPAIHSYMAKSNKRHLIERNNFNSISGVQVIDSVIELDQSPIGRTPHSNPATYAGIFDDIRTLYSQTPEAKVRGYKPGRFSFNVKGGRCEECEGNGVKKIEMHFLPDVYITCSECKGTRYNKETLSILYKGKNIADILDTTIDEAVEFFKNHPRLSRVLNTMQAVGLGYMKLGQPATTLSGGEAQRLKLSSELGRRAKGHCLYVLDEPTTGLHFNDIRILLLAIHQLTDNGHTVLVIEHNLDVIKTADWVIDLGPDGGDRGGEIIAQGTPEEVAKVKGSYTGQYLKRSLKA